MAGRFFSTLRRLAQRTLTPPEGQKAQHSPVSASGTLLFYRQHPDEWIQQHGLAWYKKIARDAQTAAALDILYSAILSLWNSASGYIPSQEEWADLLATVQHLPQSLQLDVIAQAVTIAAPQVVPPTDPTPQEVDATRFARFVLDEYLGRNQLYDGDLTGRNFGRVIEQTISCVEDGKSVQEVLWQPIPDGPWKGKWGIADILWRYPDFFDFDDENRLWMKPYLRGQATIPMPANKLIVTAFNPKYENYHGESLLHSLSYPMDFKWNSAGSCAIAEERFGMPTPVGWVDTDRTSTTLTDMITHLDALQRGQSMAFNKDEQGKLEDVELLETTRRGGSSEYHVTIQRNDRYVSKVLLGSALALEEGDNGSYSLANATAAPNFRRKIRRCINLINWTHSTQTLAWLTWFNFPAGTRPPRLAIRLPRTLDGLENPPEEQKDE